MASGESESPSSFALPEELREWLQQEADRQGITTEEYLQEILAAHRTVTEDRDFDELTPPGVDEDELDDRIEEVRSEFMELIEDVRGRVIQVKRETDEKAPLDHGHPDLRERTGATGRAVEELEAAVEELREELDAGFENYEDILEYLVETTDALGERMDTLAQATLNAREQLREESGDRRRREAVGELKRIANRTGVETAKCGKCGNAVRIALLTAPKCPHCSSTFSDVEPSKGFRGLFGSARLVTGDRPALTGGQRPEIDDELEEQLEESRSVSAEDVSWGTVGEGDR